METKPWYQSKTLWFNILFGVVSVAGIFGFADFKPSTTAVEIINAIVLVGNLVLRLLTKKAIASKNLSQSAKG